MMVHLSRNAEEYITVHQQIQCRELQVCRGAHGDTDSGRWVLVCTTKVAEADVTGLDKG